MDNFSYEESVIEDGDRLCGGYEVYNHIVKPKDRSILDELKKYPLPEDIIERADVIYKSMKKQTSRGAVRKKLFFYCVYNAYVELKINVDPRELGKKIFGLTDGDIKKSYTKFSGISTGYNPPSVNFTAKDHISDFVKALSLSEELETEVMELCDSIYSKDSRLKEMNSQTVASGIFKYFLLIKAIPIEKEKLVEITGRSTVTIDIMFKRVSIIDNS